jgi:uncharacterized protein YggE
MKSFIHLTIIGLFLTTWTYSQTTPSTLVVEGKSKIFVIPEIAKISVNLSYENKEYSICIDSLKNQSELLRKYLISHGVDATSIKSSSFQIGANYDYDSGKRRKKAYQASQSVVVEIVNDLDKVNKIADAIGKSKTKGEMNIHFELSENNREMVKAKLIEIAIKDAFSKAQIIAKSSNVTLGKILKIEYGAEINFTRKYSDSVVAMTKMEEMSESITLAISPQEIEMTDDIVMEWEILK